MDRTILIIVVVGIVVAALVFAFNQTATDTVVVEREITEVTPPQPDNLTEPSNNTPVPGGTEAPAGGNQGAPQQ